MNLEKFINGPFMVNTYLVYNDKNEAIIIDPGHDCSNLMEELSNKKLTPLFILITHGHLDHVAGISKIKEFYQDIKIYASEFSDKYIDNLSIQAMLFGVPKPDNFKIDHRLKNKDQLNLINFKIKVLSVPGHSNDSLAFYFEDFNTIFTGDALFYMSIGRTDLLDGNYEKLIKSIKSTLFNLNPETEVFPGHGDSTKIGFEIKNNPYLN